MPRRRLLLGSSLIEPSSPYSADRIERILSENVFPFKEGAFLSRFDFGDLYRLKIAGKEKGRWP
jgi:hypothetical protein